VEKEEGVAGKDIHRIGDTMNERIFKMVSGDSYKGRFIRPNCACAFWKAQEPVQVLESLR
jgi:hypothetical protein